MASQHPRQGGQRRKPRPDDDRWCAWVRAGEHIDPVAHLRDYRSAGLALCGLELPTETRATTVVGADGTGAVTAGTRWVGAAGVERCPECESRDRRRQQVTRVGWRLLDRLLDGPQRRTAAKLGRGKGPTDRESIPASIEILISTGRIEERDGKLHLTDRGRAEARRRRHAADARKRATGLGVGERLDRVERVLRSLPPEDPDLEQRAVPDGVVEELEALLDPVAAELRSVALRAGRELRRAPVCGCLGELASATAGATALSGWGTGARRVAARAELPDVVQVLACPDLCDRCVGAALHEIAALRPLLGHDPETEHELPTLAFDGGADDPDDDGREVDDEAMTYEQAAAYLGMSESGLGKLVMEDVVPFYKTGVRPKSPVRFRKRELDEWMDNGGAAGARKRRRSRR